MSGSLLQTPLDLVRCAGLNSRHLTKKLREKYHLYVLHLLPSLFLSDTQQVLIIRYIHILGKQYARIWARDRKEIIFRFWGEIAPYEVHPPPSRTLSLTSY